MNLDLTNNDIEDMSQALQDAFKSLKTALKQIADAWQQIIESLRKIFSAYRVKYPIIRKILSNYTPPVRKVQYRARSNC